MGVAFDCIAEVPLGDEGRKSLPRTMRLKTIDSSRHKPYPSKAKAFLMAATVAALA